MARSAAAYAYDDECGNRVRQEQIDGVVYDMSPSPNFRHGIVNGNIYTAIKRRLGKGRCRVFMENLDFKYHPDIDDKSKKEDYVVPDIMIACEQELLKGGAYYGVPKFIVETESPSTGERDRNVKMKIYESAGVGEFWMVVPNGVVEIYYLEGGEYTLKRRLILCDDKYDADFNADETLSLRDFPDVTMTLGEIFE